MAIKPILFNTEMVRAILDGRKSCTRRICKDANEYTVPDMDFYNADRRTYAVHNFADNCIKARYDCGISNLRSDGNLVVKQSSNSD